VKDDANGMTLSRTQAADAVPEVDAVGASRALYGPVVNREGHGVTLAELNDLRSRLHTGTLLREHEFAPR
jgi:hypothetical protein